MNAPRFADLPADAQFRIDAVCDEFEAAWQAGQRPDPRAYAADVREPERAALLAALAAIDSEYRRKLADQATEIPTPGTAPETQGAAALPLPSVPGYEVLGELGRGGMGVVYKARHRGLRRTVALKMLLGGQHADSHAQARFRAEAEAAARLQHPGIVQIHDVFFHAGQPMLAMEYVEGGSLAETLRDAALPPAASARLVRAMALALEHAHERGVVHRDLKPANVLLSEASRERERPEGAAPAAHAPGSPVIPKITDFGLAKRLDANDGHTPTGAFMGTPSYAAPEQARGSKAVGPLADVYSLGAILYECLTGRPPFRGSTLAETLDLVLSQPPVPVRRLQPGIPADLETICHKCLEKDSVRRYGSAAALAADLERFLGGRPILARPVPAWERAWRWARRRPSTAALLGVSCAAVLGLVTLSAFFNVRLSRERDAALAQKRRAEHNLLRAVQACDVLDELGMALYEKNRKDETVETFRQAEQALTQAARLQEEMLEETPDNADVRSSLARFYQNLGDLYAARGMKEEAEQALSRARRERQRLVAEHPGEGRFLAQRAITQVVDARVRFYVHGDEAGAFDHCALAIPVLERDLREPSPQKNTRLRLTHAYVIRATVQEHRGQFREALADWEGALTDATLPPRRLWFKCRLNRVFALAHLNQPDEALREIESLRADPRCDLKQHLPWHVAEIHALQIEALSTSADPPGARKRTEQTLAQKAVAALRECVASGYVKGADGAERLQKHPEFAALRGRPEFEAIVTRLREP